MAKWQYHNTGVDFIGLGLVLDQVGDHQVHLRVAGGGALGEGDVGKARGGTGVRISVGFYRIKRHAVRQASVVRMVSPETQEVCTRAQGRTGFVGPVFDRAVFPGQCGGVVGHELVVHVVRLVVRVGAPGTIVMIEAENTDLVAIGKGIHGGLCLGLLHTGSNLHRGLQGDPLIVLVFPAGSRQQQRRYRHEASSVCFQLRHVLLRFS